ncbi:MAG: tRNA uridine-5-carboxymethylaminomethyl(34) synthesis GTPase MnmE [Omnitrophica WOR_2 bacterium]
MNMSYLSSNETICAISTAPGMGAIAVIRLSGENSIGLINQLFKPNTDKEPVINLAAHTAVLGRIFDNDELLDEVVVTLFRQPNSYTGQNIVEISCHGSVYIQQKLLELLIKSGARLAQPGEFTFRAFMNGKMDLSQAEAVADLVASNSDASHQMALKQMRGGFSSKIAELRARLVHFASLIELELDFSEEDVEFVNRDELKKLLKAIHHEIEALKSSFALGNVMKQGIPVAIAGKPNVGKSTLLNALLNEERALVSEIPGTTRDAIEDTININGVNFRFIDTAGLRDTEDYIESMGIGRTYEKLNQAWIVLYVFDINETSEEEIDEAISDIRQQLQDPKKTIIPVANKTDMLLEAPHSFQRLVELDTLFVSAKRNENINLITERLLSAVQINEMNDQTIVYNLRHFEALNHAAHAIDAVCNGFKKNIPSDLIATDIRQALYHLGTITGEVTNDEILGNIFSKFCIGK